MLWIALHLPALSLEAFAATLDAARQALPLALLDGHRIWWDSSFRISNSCRRLQHGRM
jgi:hypothetical protein